MNLIDLPQVLSIIHCKRSKFLQDHRHDKHFPKAYKPGKKLLWNREEVEEWFTKYSPRTR